ncbi:E3 ubiquitin-protein ligase chip [Phtheirospermum japonicum]|uniref:RING-type E3 ubiquitin transferase n=1 Tax=Phtheirospermum japonicum TaxID=374723 RepID=A0A830CYI4_9LAMI|nr:E3 ubiquitin-protein ligase chip [Phtheirospermum japonicum]
MSPIAAAKQAEQLRQDGNSYFKKDRFGAAIDAYTEAITLCPNVPIYWTNRALCYRKRNEWTRVEEDCRKAIQLDHHSVKAHYMLGLALLQKKDFTDGVKELEKALDLGRGANPKGYMVEEIWQELARAKYLEWEHESTKRSWDLQNLNGVTYERAVILEHLQKVGKFDPITRESLYPSQLVQNLALKEAVRAYLDEHGWAYKMD